MEELKETDRHAELVDRQEQFAAMLEIPVEKVRTLKFCPDCKGDDYQWTDLSLSELEGNTFASHDEAIEYRTSLATGGCTSCAATGFEGGQAFVQI